MQDPLFDVAQSPAFAVGEDLRRPRPAGGDDVLFQALTTPRTQPDPEAARRTPELTTIEPPERRADGSKPTVPVSERPSPRDVTSSAVTPERVTRVAPLLTNSMRPTERSPDVSEAPRAEPAERALRIEHESNDMPFDPAQLADEVDARLQPRWQELALRLTRRIDDQLARAMFSAGAAGP